MDGAGRGEPNATPGPGRPGSVVVTGAGGGLGRAITQRLAHDGFVVAAFDIDPVEAERTADHVRLAGGTCTAHQIDVRDVTALEHLISSVDTEFAPLSALVNNAAIFPSGPIDEMTVENYDDAIAVNQRAYLFAARRAAQLMSLRGNGSIVNIGSITQHGGWGDMVTYVSTKGAAAAMTRALATELGPTGVRVNCVAPGAFPTRAEEMHDDRAAYERRIIDSQALKRRGGDAELAAAVSFFAGPDSSFVTGQTLNVDGGWKMA